MPSSIWYVNRGVLASNDLSNECFLALGSFAAGARKALAGASEGELAGTRITSLGSCDAGLNPDAARFNSLICWLSRDLLGSRVAAGLRQREWNRAHSHKQKQVKCASNKMRFDGRINLFFHLVLFFRLNS